MTIKKDGSAVVIDRECVWCGSKLVAFSWNDSVTKYMSICDNCHCYQYRWPMICDLSEETVDKEATRVYVIKKLNTVNMYKKDMNITQYLAITGV